MPFYSVGIPGLFRWDMLVPGGMRVMSLFQNMVAWQLFVTDAGVIGAVSLTDNHSFILNMVCYDDGTWFVSTTKGSLSKTAKYLVKQHGVGIRSGTFPWHSLLPVPGLHRS